MRQLAEKMATLICLLALTQIIVGINPSKKLVKSKDPSKVRQSAKFKDDRREKAGAHVNRKQSEKAKEESKGAKGGKDLMMGLALPQAIPFPLIPLREEKGSDGGIHQHGGGSRVQSQKLAAVHKSQRNERRVDGVRHGGGGKHHGKGLNINHGKGPNSSDLTQSSKEDTSTMGGANEVDVIHQSDSGDNVKEMDFNNKGSNSQSIQIISHGVKGFSGDRLKSQSLDSPNPTTSSRPSPSKFVNGYSTGFDPVKSEAKSSQATMQVHTGFAVGSDGKVNQQSKLNLQTEHDLGHSVNQAESPPEVAVSASATAVADQGKNDVSEGGPPDSNADPQMETSPDSILTEERHQNDGPNQDLEPSPSTIEDPAIKPKSTRSDSLSSNSISLQEVQPQVIGDIIIHKSRARTAKVTPSKVGHELDETNESTSSSVSTQNDPDHPITNKTSKEKPDLYQVVHPGLIYVREDNVHPEGGISPLNKEVSVWVGKLGSKNKATYSKSSDKGFRTNQNLKRGLVVPVRHHQSYTDQRDPYSDWSHDLSRVKGSRHGNQRKPEVDGRATLSMLNVPLNDWKPIQNIIRSYSQELLFDLDDGNSAISRTEVSPINSSAFQRRSINNGSVQSKIQKFIPNVLNNRNVFYKKKGYIRYLERQRAKSFPSGLRNNDLESADLHGYFSNNPGDVLLRSWKRNVESRFQDMDGVDEDTGYISNESHAVADKDSSEFRRILGGAEYVDRPEVEDRAWRGKRNSVEINKDGKNYISRKADSDKYVAKKAAEAERVSRRLHEIDHEIKSTKTGKHFFQGTRDRLLAQMKQTNQMMAEQLSLRRRILDSGDFPTPQSALEIDQQLSRERENIEAITSQLQTLDQLENSVTELKAAQVTSNGKDQKLPDSIPASLTTAAADAQERFPSATSVVEGNQERDDLDSSRRSEIPKRGEIRKRIGKARKVRRRIESNLRRQSRRRESMIDRRSSLPEAPYASVDQAGPGELHRNHRKPRRGSRRSQIEAYAAYSKREDLGNAKKKLEDVERASSVVGYIEDKIGLDPESAMKLFYNVKKMAIEDVQISQSLVDRDRRQLVDHEDSAAQRMLQTDTGLLNEARSKLANIIMAEKILTTIEAARFSAQDRAQVDMSRAQLGHSPSN